MKDEAETVRIQFEDSIFLKNIESEVDKLAMHRTPIPHEKILDQLLERVLPVEFREIAKLPADRNLNNQHYQIITTEQILHLAKDKGWGICQNHEFIYLYNGAYWSLFNKDELEEFLGKAAEKMGVDEYRAKAYLFRENLFKQFFALAKLPKPEQPKDLVAINLKNGTFEISPEGTLLRGFNPIDFITYQLPFKFDTKATAPRFKSYLDKVLPDNASQQILAEYLGYVFISPKTLKLEKTLLLHGTGANGKSVFFDIVNALLGPENVSTYSLQSLTNELGYQRAMLANRLVNYASEINTKMEASIFKQLVSGEPVEARLPYGRPFILTQYAKLIFNCNELPKDVEHTMAFFRRFLIVPFNVTIPEAEQDIQLAQKIIQNEMSGVFNWVLEGLNRLLNQKQFTDCAVARIVRDQYEKQSDSVMLFIEEAGYKKSQDSYESIKELYPAYRAFCDEDGNKPLNKINFTIRLERAGVVIERKNVGKVAYLQRKSELS
jgi:putative DNA primase/helicase